MQVNLNCNSPKPQFGMSINCSENVGKVLKKRTKTVTDAEKLRNIFEKQKSNDKVDISLFEYNGLLSANVHSKENAEIEDFFCEKYNESVFNRIFQGPFGFIEKMAKIADKKAAKLKKQEEIAKKLGF